MLVSLFGQSSLVLGCSVECTNTTTHCLVEHCTKRLPFHFHLSPHRIEPLHGRLCPAVSWLASVGLISRSASVATNIHRLVGIPKPNKHMKHTVLDPCVLQFKHSMHIMFLTSWVPLSVSMEYPFCTQVHNKCRQMLLATMRSPYKPDHTHNPVA